MYVCMYVCLCHGIHVLCIDWFVKRPNKVAVSQAQSNQQSTVHPWSLVSPIIIGPWNHPKREPQSII